MYLISHVCRDRKYHNSLVNEKVRVMCCQLRAHASCRYRSPHSNDLKHASIQHVHCVHCRMSTYGQE